MKKQLIIVASIFAIASGCSSYKSSEPEATKSTTAISEPSGANLQATNQMSESMKMTNQINNPIEAPQ
jgi:hypothetical protein